MKIINGEKLFRRYFYVFNWTESRESFVSVNENVFNYIIWYNYLVYKMI